MRLTPQLADLTDELIVPISEGVKVRLDVGEGLMEHRCGRRVGAVCGVEVGRHLQRLFDALVGLCQQPGGLLHRPVDCFEIFQGCHSGTPSRLRRIQLDANTARPPYAEQQPIPRRVGP